MEIGISKRSFNASTTGTVRSISRDSGEDDRYVVLNTAADFAHIEDVLILSMQEGN